MSCHKCGAPFTVAPSEFPGFNLLRCSGCERPIKLVPMTGPRPGSHRPGRKADTNRALRAARRIKMRQQP